MKKRAPTVTSLAFFDKLRWLDGRPLLDTIKPYRREIFTKAFDTFDADGTPRYSLVLAGRGKKNHKTLDLVLAALFTLVIRRSVQGSDGYVLGNDADQAATICRWRKSWCAPIPIWRARSSRWRRSYGCATVRAALQILPAKDIVGAHGKTASFVGFDEIHGYKTGRLLEALQPDPTSPRCLTGSRRMRSCSQRRAPAARSDADRESGQRPADAV